MSEKNLFVPYKGVCAFFILFNATLKKYGGEKKNLTQKAGSFIEFYVFTKNFCFFDIGVKIVCFH